MCSESRDSLAGGAKTPAAFNVAPEEFRRIVETTGEDPDAWSEIFAWVD
ncbi:MAG: hypothetical protein AB8H86_26630 [Polyangiales bacterium]